MHRCSSTWCRRPRPPRIAHALTGIHTLKLNTLEAAAVLGRDIDRRDDAEVARAAEQLVAMGADRVFLTRGELGVVAYDGAECVALPRPVRPGRQRHGRW